MDKLLNPFPSQCSAALQPLLSEKNHMQSQHLQARAHLHFPAGRKKKKKKISEGTPSLLQQLGSHMRLHFQKENMHFALLASWEL